jgi:hypothetical protein
VLVYAALLVYPDGGLLSVKGIERVLRAHMGASPCPRARSLAREIKPVVPGHFINMSLYSGHDGVFVWLSATVKYLRLCIFIKNLFLTVLE